MTFHPADLEEWLGTLTQGVDISRWLVGLSGGADSTVLLHALTRTSIARPITAIHVNHGLHPDADRWAAHCEAFSASLGVGFLCLDVVVPADSESGPEAAARGARYAALLGQVSGGDALLVGHHESDQAETLLLNLMRGSGPAGLAGIGAKQAFGRGQLLRPLLGVPGSEIVDYAKRHGLEWIEDPTNEDTRLDRNYIRHEVLPVMRARWPAVSARISRSAALVREASDLLDNLADIDLERCGDPGCLSLEALRDLSEARQRNVLRRAIRLRGLPPAPATRLYQAVHELIPSREDAQPLVTWPGAELRRYRAHLYLLAEVPASPRPPSALLTAGGSALALGPGAGALRLVERGTPGIDPGIASDGLSVRYRIGGEEIRIADSRPTRKLKKLLQEEGILPWMRDRLPLLYAGDTLVAVADLWIDADSASSRGLSIEWSGAPAVRAAL